MAELEIHHESGHALDPGGQKVGVLAAILAVGLALVTIASHRTHTEGLMLKTDANDRWQYYQARRLKLHTVELGEDLIGLLSGQTPAAQDKLRKYKAEKEKYEHEGKEIQEQARHKVEEAERAERRALRYDIGEGLLEIGLVLTSLFFISRKKMFPVLGIISGLAGASIGLTGLLL